MTVVDFFILELNVNVHPDHRFYFHEVYVTENFCEMIDVIEDVFSGKGAYAICVLGMKANLSWISVEGRGGIDLHQVICYPNFHGYEFSFDKNNQLVIEKTNADLPNWRDLMMVEQVPLHLWINSIPDDDEPNGEWYIPVRLYRTEAQINNFLQEKGEIYRYGYNDMKNGKVGMKINVFRHQPEIYLTYDDDDNE